MRKKFKYICLKLDLRKINPKKSATWNIYKQFGIDLEKDKPPRGKKWKYADFYMPLELQKRFVEEYLKRTKLKRYRNKRLDEEWLSFPVS